MWDHSSPARDWTYIPCIARQVLNNWTSREVPLHVLLTSFAGPKTHLVIATWKEWATWVAVYLSSVQFSLSCPTLCNRMDFSTPGFPIHQQLLEFPQTHVHRVGDAIQPSPPLSSPSIFPSIRVFSSESVLCIKRTKYWSFCFSISPSNEYSGLISFRMNWLDLLVVQGTLESFLQHHSSKASILQCSAFFIVQLSYPYMTTGKTIALTRWTFVGKMTSLLFNAV